MGSILFAVKSLAITIVVILALQVKIGNFTLEERLESTVRSSGLMVPAQSLADGITRLIRNTWRAATNGIGTNFGKTLQSENQPGGRQSKFNLERSAEYLRDRAESAKDRVENHLRDEGIIEDDSSTVSIDDY